MARAAHDFESLIAPVSREEFLAEYWEKKQLHIHRRQDGFYDTVFALDDVDRWISLTRTGSLNSILVKPPEGTQAGARSYRPRDVTSDTLYDAFSGNQSIVLNNLQDSWLPLTQLVERLESALCADIGVNAYLTPQGSQTMPVHLDDHDVLVLQVYGKKAWRLHALEMLSVRRLDYKKDLLYPASWGQQRLESPLLEELLLEPGDLLYIPRGMPHCARAQDSASFHLTISINPLYWTDFLQAAIEQASVHADPLRHSLPLAFINDPDASVAMAREFTEVLRAFNESVSFNETLEVVRRSRVRSCGFPRDGHFTQLARLEEIRAGSRLEKRASILCIMETSADHQSALRFGSRVVRGPAYLRPALEFVCHHRGVFQVSEIPGIKESSQLVLARRLVREGLLRLVEATVATSALAIDELAAEVP